jgi:hypothetical protein
LCPGRQIVKRDELTFQQRVEFFPVKVDLLGRKSD